MENVTKDFLAEWCGNYSNCYYYLFDGVLYNTGDCPFVCDDLSKDVLNSNVFEEVTKDAKKYHPQLEYKIGRNDCRLFRIIKDEDIEVIICYFCLNCE